MTDTPPRSVTLDVIERIHLDPESGLATRREPAAYRLLVDGQELPDAERLERLAKYGIEIP